MPDGAGTPQEVVERGLAAAAGRPCVVIVSQTHTVALRWAINGLTTNAVTSGRTVTVIVAAEVAGGTAAGSLTRSGVGAGQIAQLVEDAAALAAGTPAAEDAAPLLAGDASADWADPGAGTGPEVLTGFALDLCEVLAANRAQQRESFGFAEHKVSTTWLGTSSGSRLRHVQPQGVVEITGKSHGRSRSTWISRGTRDFTDLDVAALDAEVERRLGWQARKVELPAGRYDTVLPPTCVADLLVYAYWSADARSASEGRSVFSRPGGGTRVGDQLTDSPLTLSSDPAYPGLETGRHVIARSSWPLASVFDNGLATPAQVWLDRGRLAALPTTRHTAALSGLPVTPPVDNLILTAPDAAGNAEDLCAGLERGLLLTSLWYIREVDPMTLLLTGLTRDGVYLVEGGEIAGAVGNFRFNDSPVDLLRRVRAVGGSEIALSREWNENFPRTAMPPLLVEGFSFTGTSEAS
jgi:predicted Zn-dependent protease